MIDVLVIGLGEYVTGINPAGSDKNLGVVALSLFDMRDHGLVGEIILCGRDVKRFEAIQSHFETNHKVLYPTLDTTFTSFPQSGEPDDKAYQKALGHLKPGSAVLIFTPDDTHFEIARDAIEAGMHILVAKPLVKTVKEHQILQTLSHEHRSLLMLEVHKRFDPLYADAVDQIKTYGDFSFMTSYMSQPKTQLDTFCAWAGISSDISYYLNAHHIDLLCWAVEDRAMALSVYATASTGVADAKLQRPVEDTITLTVTWQNLHGGNCATSVHTASWIAPPSDVHSQQRFFYMGHHGEVNIDQAHRGYTLSSDEGGFKNANPLFMKYTPREGKFAGQEGYGYKSIEHFIKAASSICEAPHLLEIYNQTLPTIQNTLTTTAILEAGRISLDENRVVQLSKLLEN